MGRGAFDVNDNIMVGGYVWTGRTGSEDSPTADFTRAGIDFQLQYDTFSVFGNWMRASDDLTVTPDNVVSQSNDAFSVTGLFTWMKNKRPIIVPIVRIDSYDLDGGDLSYTDATFNLTFFPLGNWNVGLEFWANLSTPSGIAKDHRTTLLFTAVF